MINVKDQQDLLLSISKKLEKKVVAYAVGGTAMMFHGMKDATKNIDLVFSNEEDRKEFEKAAKAVEYNKIDSITVYGAEKENRPIMLGRGDERFDLFNYHVISFFFSKNMEKRAENTFEFGDKLVLKIANLHDLIIMNCATDRERDAEDVKNIIENQEIDWRIVIEEAKHQITLGKSTALLELGDFLDKLNKELKVDIPKEILDEIFNFVMEQVKEKQG